MRICTWHSEAIVSAIRRHGLGRYIRTDAKEAAICAHLWLAGRATTQTLDSRGVVVAEAVKFSQEITITHMADLPEGTKMHDCPLCRLTQCLGSAQDVKWLDKCLVQLTELCRKNQIRVG